MLILLKGESLNWACHWRSSYWKNSHLGKYFPKFSQQGTQRVGTSLAASITWQGIYMMLILQTCKMQALWEHGSSESCWGKAMLGTLLVQVSCKDIMRVPWLRLGRKQRLKDMSDLELWALHLGKLWTWSSILSREKRYVLQIELEGKGYSRLLETRGCPQEPQMLNMELHDVFSLLSFGLILVWSFLGTFLFLPFGMGMFTLCYLYWKYVYWFFFNRGLQLINFCWVLERTELLAFGHHLNC